MELILVGLDVNAEPELLQKASSLVEPIRNTLRDLSGFLDESLVLSTCNRVEIYGVAENAKSGLDGLDEYLLSRSYIVPDSPRPGFYRMSGREVAAHLFMVTSGLKSLVPGDAQITGQVRAALKEAVTAGTVGQILRLAFEHALKASRNVRSASTSAGHAESVAAAAVDLIPGNRIQMQELNAVIVGAGSTGALAAKLLSERGARKITVVNRRVERASKIASGVGGRALGLDGLEQSLLEADVVITATGAPTHLISADALSVPQIANRTTPLTILDLAIPCDVEQSAFGLPGVDLYDIYRIGDLLRNNSEGNYSSCEGDAFSAIQERLIRDQLRQYDAGERAARRGAIIRGIVNEVDSVRVAELERAVRTLQRQGVDPELVSPVLEALTRSVARKILHTPITFVRNTESDESAKDVLRLLGRNGVAPASLNTAA